MKRSARFSLWLALFGLSAWWLCLTPAHAEEPRASEQSFDSTEAVIDILREKGVISREEADAFVERHRKALSQGREAQVQLQAPAIERSPEASGDADKGTPDRLQTEARPETAEQPKAGIALDVHSLAEVPHAPDWVSRIRWGGDVRLRYQGDFFDKGNALLLEPSSPSELMNTQVDRHRGRIRARLLVKADVNENVEFAARVSTGNEKDPVSTNETLGDYMTNGNVVFDQLYLKWKPLSEVSVYCGRVPNPWFHSDLVWDPDLNFEGLAVTASKPFDDQWKGFLTAGIFPLQEVEFSKKDKWLYAGQIGAQWSPFPDIAAKLGVAYYSYENITGEVNDPLRPGEKDWTAPLFQQKGNTLMDIDPSAGIKTALASDFDELDVVATLDVGVFEPVHVVFLANYVRNLGFDRDKVAERSGNPDVREQIQGYQVGLTVGHPQVRRFGAWNAFLFYKCLEADAVLDAFTESDFHLGGTNAKGWILGGELGLAKNVWLRSRWLSSDEVEGPPLSIDVYQFDLNASF